MISEFIAAWKELSRMNMNNNNQRIKSLADASNKLIARFPVVCSSGISSKTMYLVTTALEMKYAVELKVVMQNMFTVDNTFANSATEYLNRFHTNDDTEETVHSYPRNANLYETAIIHPDYYMQRLDEQFGTPLAEAFNHKNYKPVKNNRPNQKNNSNNSGKGNNNSGGNNSGGNNTPNTPNNNNTTSSPSNGGNSNGKDKTVAFQSHEFETKLMPTDVQKANAMQPTVISVNITTVNRNKDSEPIATFNKSFDIGVKTRCIAVTSEEMVDNVVKAVKRNMTAFNFIKAVTGEISFLKDFVFMAGEIKDDYKDKGYNTIWNRLRNRSMVSKIQNFLRSSNGIIPNTTFVISKEEAEYIKVVNNIDIMQVGTITDVIKQFFLCGVMIVDEANEVLHYIDDTMKNYETTNFAALSKIKGRDENSLKDVITLLKGNRGVM